MGRPEVNTPRVNETRCVGCGLCVDVCPSFVLGMSGNTSRVFRGDWCIGCSHCVAVCPEEAIFQPGMEFEKHPKGGEGPSVKPEALELLLRERRSIRHYTPETVPEQILRTILKAGSYGPTGTNSQNVHYVVLASSNQIDQLRKMVIGFYERIFSRVKGPFGRFLISLVVGKKTAAYLRDSLPKMEMFREAINRGEDRLFYGAPVVILTHAESWDSSSPFNCSVALYHCSLMAHTLGLGCCFNGFLVNAVNHDRRIKKWLEILPDHRCYSAMALGYPRVTYKRLIPRNPPRVSWR